MTPFEQATLLAVLAALFVAATALKLLLVPAYHSTDFDVHRHWLALTQRAPLACWYFDRTSQWTLDYPPLFAYFEALLARVLVAPLAPDLLDAAAGAVTARAVLVHRASVMLSDTALALATASLAAAMRLPPAAAAAVAGIVLLSAPLLLVDHVHFQYNGVLLALLLYACALVLRRRFLPAAVAFSALVNAKHLFVVLGPAVALHLVAQYVWPARSLRRLLALAAALVAVTALALAPLLAATLADPTSCAAGSPLAQLRQIGARLFPFAERGLMHAYWAPNAWALYAAADLLAARLTGRRTAGALTSGLVEAHAQRFSVLPDVPPHVCALLTLAAMLPLLLMLWRKRTDGTGAVFLRAVSYASLAAFMFGWHVHEKAILVTLVPLSFVATTSHVDRQQWLLLAAAGGAGLLPLLDPARPADRLAGAVLLAVFWLLAHGTLTRLSGADARLWSERALVAYAVGALVLVPAFAHVVWPLVDQNARWPFVPLLVTSVYCAAGVAGAWLRASWHALAR